PPRTRGLDPPRRQERRGRTREVNEPDMVAGRGAAYSSFSPCRLDSACLVRPWRSWRLGGSLFPLPRRADALALLLRGRIAQVLARLVRQLLEAGDHVGVLRRDV